MLKTLWISFPQHIFFDDLLKRTFVDVGRTKKNIVEKYIYKCILRILKTADFAKNVDKSGLSPKQAKLCG